MRGVPARIAWYLHAAPQCGGERPEPPGRTTPEVRRRVPSPRSSSRGSASARRELDGDRLRGGNRWLLTGTARDDHGQRQRPELAKELGAGAVEREHELDASARGNHEAGCSDGNELLL